MDDSPVPDLGMASPRNQSSFTDRTADRSKQEPVQVSFLGADTKSSQTKKKLENLIDTFTSFDSDMKVGTRQRREKDENKLAMMKAEMGRIEKTLNSEIKRRVEMNKSLQAWCEQQIAAMSGRFENLLADRKRAVDARMDALTQRVTELEEQFAYEKVRIPREIEERSAELTKQLHDFQLSFEAERRSRLEREGQILKRLADHEHEVAAKFEVERAEREGKYVVLRKTLEETSRSRSKGDEKFQQFTAEEMAGLKNALLLESQTREREDDEIVEALNRYTAKLQNSLQIINSTDS